VPRRKCTPCVENCTAFVYMGKELVCSVKMCTRFVCVVQIGLKKAESTLSAASSLLSKLSGEKASWQQQADLLSQGLTTTPAMSVVAAACIVYAASVPENVRTELVRTWCSVDKMQSNEPFSLPLFLSKGRELSEWRVWGLPSDQVCCFFTAILYPSPVVFVLFVLGHI
jgi:hypothetical protein